MSSKLSHKGLGVRILRILKKTVLFLVATTFASTVIILLPVIFISFVVVTQLYKRFIVLIAKCKMPTARILNSMDGGLAMGTTNKASHHYITFKMTVDSPLRIENVREEWMERIVKKKLPNGKLQFPELQKFIRKFGGYNFWKWDRSFDIKNYIFLHNANGDEVVDKIKLLEIRTAFHQRIFQQDHGLWEMLIVNNYRHNNSLEEKECAVILFKFHHALCDGFSVVKLFYQHLGAPMGEKTIENSNIEPKLQRNSKNSFQTFLRNCLFPFVFLKFIYQYPFNLIYDNDGFYDKHPWHPQPTKSSDKKYELWIPEPINKQLFKDIKQVHNVSMTSILMTVVIGGMRRMMLERNLKLPKMIRATFPVPLPNHPDHLTNHLSGVLIKVPLCEADPVKRLQQTNEIIKDAITGPFPIFVNLITPIASNLPYWFYRNSEEMTTSVIMPSVPIPGSEEKSIFGATVISVDSVNYVTNMNCGVNVTVLGYRDFFFLSLQIESHLLGNRDEVRDMERHILDELDSLAEASEFVCSTAL